MLRTRNDANRKVTAVADHARRDSERLVPTAIAGASVQEMQQMVRQAADGPTFHDFMVNEGAWKGFRTPPLASAVYLAGRRLAQTSDTFPEAALVQKLVDGVGVQGQAVLLPFAGGVSAVAAARLPVVTRGEVADEAVLVLARPLVLPADEGVHLFSDGRAGLGPQSDHPLAALVGREREAPIVLSDAIASALELQPGLWVWSSAPLPARPWSAAPVVFGIAGLLALMVVVRAFRPSAAGERDALMAQTNRALRQSQEQLQRLSAQVELGEARTSPTLTRPAPQQFEPSRYEIVSQLGEGGMARVYLAFTRGAEGFRRVFVLKRLRPEILGVPDAVTQFIDEARLGASLVHSNIVPVFDFGRDAEGYFLAQEYIVGRDLDAVRRASLDRRRAPIETAIVLFVATEALKGLSYAHTRTTDQGVAVGLVHRDVSPNNLMISAQGEVKILDLGIAKSDQNRTQTQAGMVKGNVFFMSPEQARGAPVDARSDLFSLGLVLFAAATGDTLYRGASNFELLNRAAEGLGPNDWFRIEMLDPALAAVLKKALQTNPADRYASAAEFAAAISPSAVAPVAALQALMTQLFADELAAERARFSAGAEGG